MQDNFRANLPKKRNFVHRHPRAFIVIGMSVSMCVLFSKPIYDIMFATPEQRNQKIIPDSFK